MNYVQSAGATVGTGLVYNAPVDEPRTIAPATHPAKPVLLSYATPMTLRRAIPLWLVSLLLPASVGCFLPFAYNESPLTVANAWLRDPVGLLSRQDRILVFLAYGLWMCVPVTAMSVLLGRCSHLCGLAAIAGIVVAGVGIAMNFRVLAEICGSGPTEPRELATVIVFAGLLLVGAGMVVYCLVKARPIGVLALATLLMAYVPIVALCLMAFWDLRPGAGYCLILSDLPAYVILAVFVLRR